MRKQETELFTPAEAAVLSRLSLKAVNNAIDKKTVRARRGRAGRLLDHAAVVYLALERRLAGDTTPEFRRRLFAAIAAAPKHRVVIVGALKVDLDDSRRDVMERVKELRRAARLVTVDPEIMGGNPVFRGTRVPVHQIAELLAKGQSVERLREDYPRVSEEMIRLAPIYATAHPLRGRPRKQPWEGWRLISETEYRSTVPANGEASYRRVLESCTRSRSLRTRDRNLPCRACRQGWLGRSADRRICLVARC